MNEIKFKTNDESDELNVEEIMNKIRNNVRKKYGFNSQTFSAGNSSGFDQQNCSVVSTNNFKEYCEYANSNHDIMNKNYYISSHRPFIGKFLVEGRKIVHGEVKRYVDISFLEQNNFNANILKIVEKLITQHSMFEAKLNDVEVRFNNIEKKSNVIESRFSYVDERFNNVECRFNNNERMIGDIEGRFNNVEFRFNKVECMLKDIEGQFNYIHERFNNIEYKFNDMEYRFNDMEYKFSNIQSRFKNIKKWSNNNRIKLNNVESRSNDAETKFQLEDKIKELGEGVKTTSWTELYSGDVTEQDLVDNISYHEFFIELIKEYSELSAAGRPAKIIEVGLGNGTMSVYFSRDCKYDVYGIDNNIQVLNHNITINKNLGGYAKFMLVDAFDLDLFQKKFFDVSFSQGTLEHFDNSSIIQLIRKQLEVSKYVIFSVPSINWPTRELGNERKMSLEDWKVILKDVGFNLLELKYYKDDLHIVGVITS